MTAALVVLRSLSDSSPAAFSVYKPALIYFALVNRLQQVLKVRCGLVTKIVSRSDDNMLDIFIESLLFFVWHLLTTKGCRSFIHGGSEGMGTGEPARLLRPAVICSSQKPLKCSEANWPQGMLDYIRNNDEVLLKGADKVRVRSLRQTRQTLVCSMHDMTLLFRLFVSAAAGLLPTGPSSSGVSGRVL